MVSFQILLVAVIVIIILSPESWHLASILCTLDFFAIMGGNELALWIPLRTVRNYKFFWSFHLTMFEEIREEHFCPLQGFQGRLGGVICFGDFSVPVEELETFLNFLGRWKKQNQLPFPIFYGYSSIVKNCHMYSFGLLWNQMTFSGIPFPLLNVSGSSSYDFYL